MKNIIFFIFISSLASCGFRPAYKTHSNPTYSFLESIEVVPLNSVDGVEYFNHINSIFPASNEIKYRLETSISYIENYGIIQKNTDALRNIITIKVNYKLTDIEKDRTLASNNFSRLSSYSTSFSPYGNQSNQQNTQKLLAIMAAEEVRNRIILLIENKSE